MHLSTGVGYLYIGQQKKWCGGVLCRLIFMQLLLNCLNYRNIFALIVLTADVETGTCGI